MLNRCRTIAIGCALALSYSVSAFAQASPAPGTQPGAAGPAAAPNYVAIYLETDVNRPAAEVWKRIGKYCDISEWMRIPCTITAGKEGEVGSVRSVANEVLVAKTEMSYTYTQPVRPGTPYNLYHGTLEARAVTPTTTEIAMRSGWKLSTLARKSSNIRLCRNVTPRSSQSKRFT